MLIPFTSFCLKNDSYLILFTTSAYPLSHLLLLCYLDDIAFFFCCIKIQECFCCISPLILICFLCFILWRGLPSLLYPAGRMSKLIHCLIQANLSNIYTPTHPPTIYNNINHQHQQQQQTLKPYNSTTKARDKTTITALQKSNLFKYLNYL